MGKVLTLVISIGRLWPYVILGCVDTGLLGVVLNYVCIDFFARKYTTLPADDITCETTPDASYCRTAVNDVIQVQGLLAIVTPILTLIVGPSIGALSDAVGRRWIILVCSALNCVPCFALFAYVHFNLSLWVYFILSPLYAVPTDALILSMTTDLVQEEDMRSTAFGLNRACYVLSTLLGVAIAGTFTVKASINVALGMIVVLLMYAFLFMPETLPKQKRASIDLKKLWPGAGLKVLFRNRVLMCLTTIMITSSFVDGGFAMIWIPYLQKYASWDIADNTTLNFLSACASMFGMACLLPLISRGHYGEIGVLFVSRLAAVTFGWWFCFLFKTWEVFLGVAIFFPFCNLMFPAIASLKSKLVREDEQGTMQAALSTVTTLGTSLAPIIYTPLFMRFDYSDVWSPLASVPVLWASVLTLPSLAAITYLPRLMREYGYTVGHPKKVGSREPLMHA